MRLLNDKEMMKVLTPLYKTRMLPGKGDKAIIKAQQKLDNKDWLKWLRSKSTFIIANTEVLSEEDVLKWAMAMLSKKGGRLVYISNEDYHARLEEAKSEQQP